MKVLVTGGAGFIGSAFVRRLAEQGEQVVVLDKLTYAGNPANLEGVEHEFHRGDIADPEAVARAAAGCEAIVNFAAETHVDRSILGPAEFIVTDVLGTQVLLDHARNHGIRHVQVSTDEVYGDIPLDAPGATEESPLRPSSPYSASKITSEAFIYSYARCYGLKYLVFRFSNVYGRFDNDLWRMERVLPLFMHQLSRSEPITIYGGDEKVLDFTFVDDCIDGITRGVERLAAGSVENETVNLAYGQGNTLVRAAELIADQLEVTPRITKERSLVGEVTRYVAEITKARELLGWQPETPLDAGIPRAVDWFREWRAAHPEEDTHIVSERQPGDIEHAFKPAPV